MGDQWLLCVQGTFGDQWDGDQVPLGTNEMGANGNCVTRLYWETNETGDQWEQDGKDSRVGQTEGGTNEFKQKQCGSYELGNQWLEKGSNKMGEQGTIR